MRRHTALVSMLGAALLFVSPARVSAQCGTGFVWLGYFLGQPQVAAMFEGTVVDIQRRELVLVVTFDVSRVWKGDAAKRQVVYRAARLPAEQRGESATRLLPFDLGQRYVVIAHALAETERAEFGFTTADMGTLATGFCGDGSRPAELAEVDDMGPGRAPR